MIIIRVLIMHGLSIWFKPIRAISITIEAARYLVEREKTVFTLSSLRTYQNCTIVIISSDMTEAIAAPYECKKGIIIMLSTKFATAPMHTERVSRFSRLVVIRYWIPMTLLRDFGVAVA